MFGRPKGSVNKNGKCAQNKDLLLKMFRDGCGIVQIAQAVGTGEDTVKGFLRSLGEKFDFSKSPTSPRSTCGKNKDLLLKMCAEGMSLEKMASAIGSGPAQVKRFLRGHGVDRVFSVSGYTKEKSPHWKGGVIVDKDGYRLLYCPDHPYVRKHTPYVLEHRLVMENILGRYLLPEEVVHHKDKNKCNNSPENLQLFSANSEHLAEELKNQCPKWTEKGRGRIQKLIAHNATKRRGQIRVPLTPDEMRLTRKKYRFVTPHETVPHAPLETAQ